MAGVAKSVFGAFLAIFVLFSAAPSASAASALDQYRAQGVIAERYDGLVEVHGKASPAVAQLVKEVNAKRLEIYRKRAQSQHVSVEAVGKIYASEIMSKAPAGTYFRKADGSYVRK